MPDANCMEVWLPVVGWIGYEVSNCGQVRSRRRRGLPGNTPRIHRGEPVILRQGGNRYRHVVLCAERQQKCIAVHHLMLEAFVSARPEGCFACHRNDCKTDNRLENLYWGSPRANYDDARRNDRYPHGEGHKLAKISKQVVLEIRQLYQTGNWFQQQLAAKFGISQIHVSRIVRGEAWQHDLD